MRAPRSTFLLFAFLLCLGLSLMVPAEDVSGTAYDESEQAPWEISPMFSLEVAANPDTTDVCGAVQSRLHCNSGERAERQHSGVDQAADSPRVSSPELWVQPLRC
ncbi:MAG TPA: hypothetical protein VMT39_01095 [Candidatus Bathyarchaeia archaeon]|nr:hypothetical protein [Candidatus Bathyarchaeia archaeon]